MFLTVPFFVYAQDDYNDSGGEARNSLYNEYTSADEEAGVAEDENDAPAKPDKAAATLRTGKRESRRYFEFGILNLNLTLLGLDMGNLLKGQLFDFNGFDPSKINDFSADVGIFTNPIYFKVSVKDSFNLDFFTGADFKANFDLPSKTIDTLTGLKDMVNTPPPEFDPEGDIGAAFNDYMAQLDAYMATLQDIDASMSASVSMFAEMGLGVSKTFFNNRLYIRAAPSLFFTLLYMEQSAANLKGYNNKDNEYGLQGDGIMKLYSAWDLDKDVNPFSSPGVDLTLEACYALLPILDTGISVSHIPVIPSTLNHSKSIDVSGVTMNVKVPSSPEELADQIINKQDNPVNINIPETEDLMKDSDDENKQVRRPTRFDLYALVKPFKSPVLVVRPDVGLTINSSLAPMLFNWALDVQFNAPKIFSAFAGTGLTETVWMQRAGIILDFRAFEVDIAAALTGKTFLDCFSDQKGLSLGIGFKLGF